MSDRCDCVFCRWLPLDLLPITKLVANGVVLWDRRKVWVGSRAPHGGRPLAVRGFVELPEAG